ncbi:emp24p/erv25p- protein [Puttea exsequens]|nr:emp24p/erv25p- protein [Puttea exsequens]
MDGASPKCFYEELPKDTLVVGHYSALQHNPQSNAFTTNPDLSITVTVDEVFDNDHRVVNTRGSNTGKFTFSAADAGDHRICFTPSGHTSGGWLSGGAQSGQVKMTLDMAIGETSTIESTDKSKMTEIAQKVRDLNSRLLDIRREQVFQREREAEFRDQSESTNARVVRWTLLQLIVLGVTCAWQLSHLRAFFIKQKLT